MNYATLPDFESQQTFLIKKLIKQLGQFIQNQYETPDNTYKPKEYYRLGLDWFMYASSINETASSNLLDGIPIDDNTLYYLKDDIKYKFGSARSFDKVQNYLRRLVQSTRRQINQYKPIETDVTVIQSDVIEFQINRSRGPATVRMCLSAFRRLIDLGPEDISDDDLLRLVFAILMRYELFGVSKSSMCLAIEEEYKSCPTDKTTLEMFANPVNRHCESFCSLFPDLEQAYGSIGSALTVPLDEIASFDRIVANPPYINSIMERMAERLVALRENGYAGEIRIIIPDWRPTEDRHMPYRTFDILQPYIKSMNKEGGEFEYTDTFTGKQIAASKKGTLRITI